jgi:hypothetical protein
VNPPDLPTTIRFTIEENGITPFFAYAHWGDRLEWHWSNSEHNVIFLAPNTAVKVVRYSSGPLQTNGTFYFYLQEDGAVVRETSFIPDRLVHSSEV